MKNLDINPSSTNYSDERSRQVVIEFTGGIHSEMMQRGTHTMKVPYSSFSKKLQTIHRLGGKIINVSIPHFQLDIAKVDSKKVDFIPEEISEEIPKEILAIASAHPFVEPLESSVETASQKIPDISSENISAVELLVVSPNNREAISETVSNPKKSRTSTKTSHGFNKRESTTKAKEAIAISEPIVIEHQVSETVVEKVVEPISENIVEETIPIAQKVEPLESTVPLSKQKKTKSSTKSNLGFNKPKDDTQEKRLPRKPKS